MFTHIAMFRFRPDVDEASKQEVEAKLHELPRLIPDVRAFHVGRDAGISEGNWDMVVVAKFDDADGYRTYAAHPDHKPAITAVRAVISERAGIQFEE